MSSYTFTYYSACDWHPLLNKSDDAVTLDSEIEAERYAKQMASITGMPFCIYADGHPVLFVHTEWLLPHEDDDLYYYWGLLSDMPVPEEYQRIQRLYRAIEFSERFAQKHNVSVFIHEAQSDFLIHSTYYFEQNRV